MPATEDLSPERWVWCSMALLAAGVVLVLFRLGTKSLWLDEATSFIYARQSWPAFRETLWRDSNASLYYLLLRGWATFGSSEAWLRGLSAIFALAALLPAMDLARRLVGSRAALLFGLLLVTNLAWLSAAQEARAYSLLLLLNLLGAWATVRAALGDGAGYWAAAALSLGLGIYAHFYTAFTILAFGIWFVLFRRRIATAGVPAAALLLGALTLPAALRIAVGRRVAPPWLPPLDLAVALNALTHLVGVGRIKAFVVFTLMGAVALVGALALTRARPSTPPPVGAVRWLPEIWLVVGCGGPLLTSLVGPAIVSWRYFIIVLPPLLLLSAHGASLLPRRHLAAVAVLFAALELVVLWTFFFQPPLEDWRAVSHTLFTRLSPGDAVAAHAAYVDFPLKYYETRAPDRVRLPLVDLGSRMSLSPIDVAALEELAGRVPRLWLVLSHACGRNLAQRGDEVLTIVARAYRPVESIQFTGVQLFRYQSRMRPEGPSEAEIAIPPVCVQ